MSLYLVYLILLLSASFLLLRYFIQKRFSSTTQLYNKALRVENLGNYEEALLSYENALKEVKKFKFNRRLENKIVDKISVLRTTSDYLASQKFVR